VSTDPERNTGTDRLSQYGCKAPYTELADIYDRVMDHVDYPAWAQYIASLLRRFNVTGCDILDIACGTGSLPLELSILGFTVTCTDLSVPMLKKAAEKFRRNELPLRLFSSHMNTLPLDHTFDAVICIYDSINYVTSHEDFVKVLSQAASKLNNDGVFIFDVCTIKNSELFFSNHTMVENFGDIRYERFCRYDRKNRIQENHFSFYKHGLRFTESHYQRIYRLNEIENMISESPLDELGRFDDMSFYPGSEDSERVHFVLGKRT